MSDDLAQRLRSATGAPARLTLQVSGPAGQPPTLHEFEYPYMIVGRGAGCDVLLTDGKVSFRHAYFQVVEGRLFCVDLASRNGVHWTDGPRKFGWVEPGVPVQIGPYAIRVVGNEEEDRVRSQSLADLNPLERYRGQVGEMPRVDLEFLYETSVPPTWSVNRLLTLIGRSALCKLRFETPAVSAVHCALLLTRQGLWAIDLLGRGGTKVDGEDIRVKPLETGNEVAFGGYQISVFYESPADVASIDRLTDNAAEAETSMEDLESPFLQDEAIPDTACQAAPEGEPSDARDESAQEKSAGAGAGTSVARDGSPPDWLGTIFRLDAQGETLVVVPMVDGCSFRYQQLHVEANSLQRKFETRQFINLVVDLKELNYFGSELIGVLIRLARAATNGQGRAALCSPSPRMMEVLEGMRLTKLWPIFDSREEALSNVRKV